MYRLFAATLCLFCLPVIGVNGEIATPSALQGLLNSSTQGAVVSLCGVDPLACPLIPMSQKWSGGKLIFSDSPESPDQTGILYRDTNLPATSDSAPNRIFVYHVNINPSSPMKFCVLIKNNGASTATLAIRRVGIAGPSGNYALVGETAFYRWLTNNTTATFNVLCGQTVRLDTNFDSMEVADGALVNGIWDYTFTQPHTVTICATKPLDNPLAASRVLAVLPRDIHDRGTFANCNKACDMSTGTIIDTAAGIRQFPLAGNGDAYVSGYDETVSPPAAAIDDGNYGVVYSIHFKTSDTDGRALAFLANPQGGLWCGALATDRGILPGGAFVIPSNGRTISSPNETAIAGEYFPNGRKTIQLEFMPTGASAFPVLLLAVPFSSKAVSDAHPPGLAGVTKAK